MKRPNNDIKIGGESPDYLCPLCCGAGIYFPEALGTQDNWQYCTQCTEIGRKEEAEWLERNTVGEEEMNCEKCNGTGYVEDFSSGKRVWNVCKSCPDETRHATSKATPGSLVTCKDAGGLAKQCGLEVCKCRGVRSAQKTVVAPIPIENEELFLFIKNEKNIKIQVEPPIMLDIKDGKLDMEHHCRNIATMFTVIGLNKECRWEELKKFQRYHELLNWMRDVMQISKDSGFEENTREGF